MKLFSLLNCAFLLIPAMACTQSPKGKIGGPCEGCEAIYESGISFDSLKSSDTLAAFFEPGTRLHIAGKVFQPDGRTPAAGVIIYFYHTDSKGLYATKGNETGWGQRHGFLRGWLKTDANGEYGFFTIRPASYPNSNNPQHIHMTIKEQDKNEYWIDEIHFMDDPLLTPNVKQHFHDRGGSGLVTLRTKNEILHGERNIILGKNIPAYH